MIDGECKTMEQRVAILMDKMTTAGSDDLYELAYFSVTMPKVRLTVPETVKIGDPISVKVEMNMEEGVEAFVSLLFNGNIINETTVVVKSGSGDASFDTNGLQPGKYTVTGSIKEEAYDEVGVRLVETEERGEERGAEVAEEIEEVEESIPQNEPVTEPETTVETIENAGESELNEGQEGEEQKLPVIAWDLVIAVFVAIFISIVVRRRR
nr:hypothetical membrane protein [uncultured archaeon]